MGAAFLERLPFEDRVSVTLCNPVTSISVTSGCCIPHHSATDVGSSIKVSCSDVSVRSRVDVGAILAYFRITATRLKEIRIGDHLYVDKDVLWVTPDIIEQIMIMSNLEWSIN